MDTVRGLEPWRSQTSGFIQRELTKNDDGLRVDVLHWRSLSEALSAAAEIMAAPEGQAFGSKIDETSITMMHVASIYRFRQSCPHAGQPAGGFSFRG